MRQQTLAGLGERDAAPVALQQRPTQLDFERVHLAAQRGLGDRQNARRGREAVQFGDVHEVVGPLEAHGRGEHKGRVPAGDGPGCMLSAPAALGFYMGYFPQVRARHNKIGWRRR